VVCAALERGPQPRRPIPIVATQTQRVQYWRVRSEILLGEFKSLGA
jgi:hypothetical protein